ncbi:hypothetical protein FA95DRAFT_1594016 [Auriscalpium vulgare]|uniref:Uncharacterized protein n=1 Tax=Auriscalpium vulgare TaxID=40419 RepID=A0ACB8S213_9AGAM|nr:hypothetical protein FA95DRAFT_1594016 [Auriscalpium vulgare]
MTKVYEESPRVNSDALAPYFDRSVSAVRQTAERLEEDYGKPILKFATASFSAYPVSSTFAGIFASLSLLPVLTFLSVTLFTLAFALTLAVSIAFAFSTLVFILSGGVLLSILAITLFFSSILTVFALCSYLAARLAFLVRSDGRRGVASWAEETKETFMRTRTPKPEPIHDSDSSEDSGIVIKGEVGDNSAGGSSNGYARQTYTYATKPDDPYTTKPDV